MNLKLENKFKSVKFIKNCFLIFFVFIFIINFSALAQNVTVKISIDTNNVLIGDQINLSLKLNSDKPIKVIWPIIPDTIGNIEIINKSKIDTNLIDNKLTLIQKLVVTSFDSGSHTFQPLTFLYDNKNTNSLTPITSDSIVLNFNTVEVDTSKAIKDIKPPLEEPVTIDEYLPYILIGLIAIAVIILGIYLWKRALKKQSPLYKLKPKIPPYLTAFEELNKLNNEKLWHKGEVKKYYIRLTEIIRTYIEFQFTIPALESTSDEIIQLIEENKTKISNNLEKSIYNLRKIFELGDLAKFAKYQPLPDENTLAMNLAVEFVELTKPVSATDESKNIGNINNSKSETN